MKIILRVTDVLTILGYRCRDTCHLVIKILELQDQVVGNQTINRVSCTIPRSPNEGKILHKNSSMEIQYMSTRKEFTQKYTEGIIYPQKTKAPQYSN